MSIDLTAGNGGATGASRPYGGRGIGRRVIEWVVDPSPRAAPADDLLHRVLRRSVTMPAFFLGLLGWTALLPLSLPLALASDLVLRRRLAASRFVLALLAFLAFECFGVLAVTAHIVTRRATWDRLFRLEAFWADALLGAMLRLFGMHLQIHGLDELLPGPVLIVGNHVSVADALLPAAIASARGGLRVRYVAKGELIWDPCVDLACHVLPNVFVQRGSADTPGDLTRVLTLLDGIGPKEGIVLLPEGTRFTPERRAAALARREREGPYELLERDRALRCLMPPRLGGLLALLDAHPGLDLVVMAHSGLEGVVRIPDLWSGVLVGRTLRVSFWRLSASSIPAERAARIDWFYAQWERLDRWIARERGLAP